MNIHSFTYSVIRILAVYLVISGFIPSFAALGMAGYWDLTGNINSTSGMSLLWGLECFFYAAAAAVLWLSAGWFSKIITGKFYEGDTPEQKAINAVNDNIIESGIILIGLYIIIKEIPLFISNIYFYINSSQKPANHDLKYIVTSALQIAAAAYAVTGREKIIYVIKRLKTAGIEKT